MGADALLMNYRSARRKLAKETTSIAQEAALGDGPRGKKPTKNEVRASVRRLVGQASVEALRACEEVHQAYRDHECSEPRRRQLEAPNVRINGERAIIDPMTAPYMYAIKAEEPTTAAGSRKRLRLKKRNNR